jgi:hypothetical protein
MATLTTEVWPVLVSAWAGWKREEMVVARRVRALKASVAKRMWVTLTLRRFMFRL